MSRPAVVYVLLTAAFLLLLTLPRSPRGGRTRQQHGRRLRIHHVPFDPLVEELKQRAEDRGLLDSQPFQEKLDAIWAGKERGNISDEIGVWEEFLGQESGLNETERLVYLFPLLDKFPEDGALSFEELELWNQRRAMDRLVHATATRMKALDKDGDGAITLREFLSQTPDEEIDWENMELGKWGWWKEQFLNADEDGNGSLDDAEFNHFLHPEDSRKPKIELWLLNQKLREMDQDKDGKLSFQEFRDRAHHSMYRVYAPVGDENSDPQHRVPPNFEMEFAKLDVNKNKFLTVEELKAILYQLYPGELSHATHYSKYLMKEVDDNGDGKLTPEEVLNHRHEFYSTVMEEGYYDDGDDDYDDDYGYHEELR